MVNICQIKLFASSPRGLHCGAALLFGDVSTEYMGCLCHMGWGDALKKVGYSLGQWTNPVNDPKRHKKTASLAAQMDC